VFVIVLSWMRKTIGTVWWRRSHVLAVPVFALALVHGIFTGTDTTRPWMWWSYVASGMLVVFLVLVRGLTAGVRPTRPAATANTGKHAPAATRPRSAASHPGTVTRSTPPRPDAEPASV
jgi:DMSO/TMAO reductase YedYZ heme-binding membrane subunit